MITPGKEDAGIWHILKIKLVKGFVGAALARIGGLCLGFCITAVLARTMGPSGFGTYTFILAVISVLSVPVQFGLPQLVTRETARGKEDSSWGLIKGLWRWSGGLSAVISFGAGIVIACILELVSVNYHIEHHREIILALISLPLMALNSLTSSALTGLKYITLGQLGDNVLRPALFLSLLIILLLWQPGAGLNVGEAIVFFVTAAAVSLVINLGLLRSVRPGELAVISPAYDGRVWINSATALAFVSALPIINQQVDLLLLGTLSSNSELGTYRVASQLSLLAGFVLQIINLVIAPYISELYANKHMERLQELITHSARTGLAGSVIVGLVFFIFGSAILSIAFGNEYVSGVNSLRILIIGQLINAAMGSVGVLLNMTRNERLAARGMAIATLLNIILNILLIPKFGKEGAAIASCTSIIIWNIILWRSIHTRLGLDTTAFKLAKIID